MQEKWNPLLGQERTAPDREARGGDDRPVEVAIPDLGRIRLAATACGSVYRATLTDGKPVLAPVGKQGLTPSDGL